MKNGKGKAMKRAGEWLALGMMATALVACGGGGNGGIRAVPASPPPPPPPPPPPTTAQPPLDAQLSLTNAYAAHNAGYDGSGSTIGIVDSGIMHTNPTVAGRVKAELIYVDPSQNNVNIDDVVGHGTWVSEMAAGAPFDQFPGGIAPGAELVSARIISDKAPDDDGTRPPSVVTAQDAQFFQQVNSDLISYDVNIMNNSWGGITWDTTDASVNQAFDQAYRSFVIQHDGLVVFAAGNDSNPDPSTIAALPSVAPDLERGWLTVVALDSNNPTQIESYSNKCGVAMDYCLAAPGDVIVLDKDATSSTVDPNYYIVKGTSLAAPIVSGAAALVWQAFPYFNNDNVRQTLLGTADDLGAQGPDQVFGYGALNVGNAVRGPGKFDWGDFSVTFDGTTSTWSNDITGNGGLVKNGTGTLVLQGVNSYLGGTQVLGGTLQAVATLPGDVDVGSGGTLDSVPGVGQSLSNAGTVIVAGGNTEVGGDYSQTSTGTLSVSLGSVMAVSGSVTLDGTLNIRGAETGYTKSSHQDVLTFGGTRTGAFSQMTLASGVFLSTSIQYGSNDVWLNTQGLTITTTAAAMGITSPAAFGAAQRVQAGFDALDSHLASGARIDPGVLQGAGAIQQSANAAVAKATLQSLSGQLHAASASMLLNGIDAANNAVSTHFDDLLGGRSKPGVWYANLGWEGGLQRSGYTGANFRSNGAMVGADFVVGQHALLGYALGQSQGLGQLDASWDHDRTRMDSLMVYGGAANGPWYASAQLGQGWYREDMQRLLQLGSLGLPVGTDMTGRFLTGSLEGGRQFHVAGLRLTPFLDVRYQRLEQGGFAEDGGLGFGLMADARTVGRLQAGLGLRATSGWRLGNGMWVQFDGSADWQHALHQYGNVFNASFTGFNDWLPVDGIGLSRNVTTVRTGVSLWPTRSFGLRLGLAHEQGSRLQSNSAMLQGTVSF